MSVAAVDVGTNSVRLLVAERGEPLTPVAREMRITRLGAGVDATGHLDDAALERTLDCLGDYARQWQELGAERVRIAATSAVRDAADRDRFFDGVRERTGVAAEVLTGDEEARTAFRGATATLDAERPCALIDIGGGSTEVVYGDDAATAMASRQIGCVRVTERFLVDEVPTPAQLAAATGAIDAELEAVAQTVDPGRARTLVGVAGTVTTLAALHLGLSTYEPERIHGTWVPARRVLSLTGRLARMPVAERAALGPMAPGREDVIVAGALILQRFLERFELPGVLASEADILDGLALGLLDA